MTRLDEILKTVQLPFQLADLQASDIEDAIIAGRYGWFLEVGCGKTVCATLTALAWNNEQTVIICPPILSWEWEKWLRSVGQTSVSVYEGPKRTLDMLNARWVIMSHAIFRNDFKTLEKLFRNRKLDLIVDEAQALKNPKSKLYQDVRILISPKNRNTQMLTATPKSKPEDTFTYMRIKTPDLYQSFGHWKRLHVEKEDIFGTIIGYQNLDLLRDNFALKTTTRTKKEVFGNNLLPIFQPLPYELEKKHLKLYNRLADEQLLILDNGTKIDATSAQRLRHALQQIVCNYGHFSGNEADVSSVFDLLDSVVEQVDPMPLEKSKFVVWTYYKMTSKAVYDHLVKQFGEKAVALAYSESNSKEAVRRIMHEPECRILVGQPGSVGMGLNLQHVCSEMLFLEMATTSIPIKQAIGRVDRAGQTVRPTIRFAQALETIQPSLFNNLLTNDDLVAKVHAGVQSLRDQFFGVGQMELQAELLRAQKAL